MMPSLDAPRYALERFRPAGDPPADPGLVALHDLAGRPRGTGFVADLHGTVITGHEVVDGLPASSCTARRAATAS